MVKSRLLVMKRLLSGTGLLVIKILRGEQQETANGSWPCAVHWLQGVSHFKRSSFTSCTIICPRQFILWGLAVPKENLRRTKRKGEKEKRRRKRRNQEDSRKHYKKNKRARKNNKKHIKEEKEIKKAEGSIGKEVKEVATMNWEVRNKQEQVEIKDQHKQSMSMIRRKNKWILNNT